MLTINNRLETLNSPLEVVVLDKCVGLNEDTLVFGGFSLSEPNSFTTPQ